MSLPLPEIRTALASLQQACRLLDTTGDHDVAAMTSSAMDILRARYGLEADQDVVPAS